MKARAKKEAISFVRSWDLMALLSTVWLRGQRAREGVAQDEDRQGGRAL